MKYVKTYESYLNESHQFDEVYHGTNSIMANEILSKGFDLNKAGLKTGDKNALIGVSTTINYNIAKEHAEWAVEEHGGDPVILMSRVSNLNLMSGKDFYQELDKLRNVNKILENAKKKKYDGVIMFDYDSEEGLEEFEINIFDPKKIKWSKA